MFKKMLFFLFLTTAIALSACSTLEVRFDQTRTPVVDVDEVATLAVIPSPTPTKPTPAIAVTELKIVYSKGQDGDVWSGNVWLWSGLFSSPENGSTKQLTNSGADYAPMISDDGQVVVFRRDSKLWAINADGSNERLLTPDDSLNALPYIPKGKIEIVKHEFAPESHDIYFSTVVTPDGGDGKAQYDLAVVNTDTLTLKSIMPNGKGGDLFFSPDRTKIAISGRNSIQVLDVSTHEAKTVFTFQPVMTYSMRGPYLLQLVWLNDNSGFRTILPPPGGMHSTEPYQFLFIPVDGGEATQLQSISNARNPLKLSPDGTKALFGVANGNDLDIQVIEVTTGEQVLSIPKQTLDTNISNWTPNSQGIVYKTSNPTTTWLFVLGSQPISLCDTHCNDLTWIDNDHFFFTNGNEIRLRTMGQPSIVIAEDPSRKDYSSWYFDYVLVKH